MTQDEMNKYFICSIVMCAKDKETPNAVFFKRVCLYGRLNKVHCYPIDYIESDEPEKQRVRRLKINVLEKIILQENFNFPPLNKLKKVDEDWSKMIKFLFSKEPYNIVFTMISSIPNLRSKIKNVENTGSPDNLKKNKELVENAKTAYPVLDWIEPDLDNSSDNAHKMFATIIKAICKYSTSTEEYNSMILNYGERIIPLIEGYGKNVNQFSSLVNDSDNIIVPEIFSIIGIIERLFYPFDFTSLDFENFCLRIFEIIKYFENFKNLDVLIFRFTNLMGYVFTHPKITKFVTIPDFERNIAWLKESKEILQKLTDVVSSENEKKARDLKNKCNKYGLEEQTEIVKVLELQDTVGKVARETKDFLRSTLMQSGKIDLENDNPEKPTS